MDFEEVGMDEDEEVVVEVRGWGLEEVEKDWDLELRILVGI